MQTEQVSIDAEMQVTLEFLSVEGILDRAIFAAKVRECVECRIKQKIMSGKDVLTDVLLIKYHPNKNEEISRKTVNLLVTWEVHRPWWSTDHPDWGSVPGVNGLRPAHSVPAIW